MGASKHAGVCANIWGIQTYKGVSKHTGALKPMGASKNMRGIQIYRGCPNI